MARALAALLLAAAALVCVSGARVYDVAVADAAGGGVAVAARVDAQGGAAVAAVKLRYTLNFDKAEHEATMMRGSDGRWSVTLSGLPAGALLRGSVSAADGGGASLASAAAPPSVVAAAAVAAESRLPTLHWFVADPEAARWDAPVPCEVLFDAQDGSGLRYYGNVTTHRTGSERKDPKANLWAKGKSKDWVKRNFKLAFGGRVFRWRAGAPPVAAIELHGMYQESGPVSYMRKALAVRFMDALGVPAVAARHVRVRQNGQWFGLYVMVEQVDRVFLARKGLDPEGHLFKAAHWKYSNLRAPDTSSECPFTAPDYDYWPRGTGKCPIIFSEAKGTTELPAPHLKELEALAAAVNAGDLSAFDLNAVVTEMAAQTAMLHHDRCTKNRFYHRDPHSGRWTVIPYDMKDAFATDNRGNGRNCAAQGNPCSNAESYCILSCEAFNSPFFCDASHPQDVFPESDGRSTYNHLVDAVLRSPAGRAAYLAKLRYIMDTYLSTGWLQAEVGKLHDSIAASAKADNAKWGAGDIDVGTAALLAQMAARREQLYGKYGYLWASQPPASSVPLPALPKAASSSSPLRVGLGPRTQARIVGGLGAAAPGEAMELSQAAAASSSDAAASSSDGGFFDGDDDVAEDERWGTAAPAPAAKAAPAPAAKAAPKAAPAPAAKAPPPPPLKPAAPGPHARLPL